MYYIIVLLGFPREEEHSKLGPCSFPLLPAPSPSPLLLPAPGLLDIAILEVKGMLAGIQTVVQEREKQGPGVGWGEANIAGAA